jgi:hypothetical protein
LILLFKLFEKGFEHPDEEMNMVLKALLNVLVENLNKLFWLNDRRAVNPSWQAAPGDDWA